VKLPPHKAELSITHNAHKTNYETVADTLAWRKASAVYCGAQEEMDELKAGDEMWEVHWYPDTPVGFYVVYAATLERALERALELANDGTRT